MIFLDAWLFQRAPKSIRARISAETRGFSAEKSADSRLDLAMERTNWVVRGSLAVFAGAIVAYCVLVMVVVATAPDLRLRFLLVGPVGLRSGIIIEDTINVAVREGKPVPQPQDILIELDGQPVKTSLDFMREQFAIRNRDFHLRSTSPASESQDAQNYVPIKFVRHTDSQEVSTAVKIQAVPMREVGLTLVWFLLELIIFSVGAVGFWSRPFDDAARLFFVMCTVTLAAFVGGFHWWTVGSNFWLNLPFAVCAILLPAVILHFFLVYPRPKVPLVHWPTITVVSIYAIPVLTILSFLLVDGGLWFLPNSAETQSEFNSQLVFMLLNWLRIGVYSYFAVAAIYFLIALAALTHSWLTARNPIEQNQVRWILRAGCAASFFIGYALYLAFFYRAEFALGGGRIPMFLASLVFMFAYAVGIVRYKLMLIDQIVNRGMWYYVLSYAATATIAFAISCGTLAMTIRKAQALEQPTWIIAGILMLAVVLLIWLRDSWQTFVDRRFFREKYRLDKALQRMNQAAGRLADVDFLSERMLISCRDVLQSELTALYLRDAQTSTFRLAGAQGVSTGLPMQFSAPEEFCQALQSDPTLQRVTSGSRDDLSPTQSLLRLVKADLVHGLETNGEITGIVVLGGKQNGLMYSAEDLTFLTALGQITGIALHCANVHQNLKHLNEELRTKVDQLAQQRQRIAMLEAEIATNRVEPVSATGTELRRDSIIGRSPALNQVLEMVRKVAPSETSVLVRGESGTGKELLAKAIHENSSRRNGPLISVNCAAFSTGLLESELFGHVRGSFTGAHENRPGRFELAHGGTLFLDEIGDISAETQIKLLRVLQQREFEPVGGTKTIQVDVRMIAATHQNLERLITEGKFREDLYYRLNVISIHLPPLRERPDDILDLAAYFLKSAAVRGGRRVTRFDDDALNALMQYTWPGNIRELQNVIERAVVLSEHEAIELGDLPVDIQKSTSATTRAGSGWEPNSMDSSTSSVLAGEDPASERRQLVDALHACDGNKTKAARRLGLPRSTYFSKLKKYGIDDNHPPEPPRFGRLPR